MQQHPVPQNISSYEFRLVGDMTLKQFFQLAGGVLMAVIFYASGLPGIIKWPLIISFVGAGASLAFLPFEDRPLWSWIISFIKAVYSPTRYTWVEQGEEEVFAKGAKTTVVIAAPQGQEKAEVYLKAIPKPKIFDSFDKNESSFFQNVASLFQTVQVNQIKPVGEGGLQSTSVPGQNDYTPVAPLEEKKVETNLSSPQVVHYDPVRINPIFQRKSTWPWKRKPKMASFVPVASPPAPPTQPNTISGQVLDASGAIIEGAILEVRDSSLIPVRAFKTNKLGHFMNVTPLKEGVYTIETEKEGYSFETVNFETRGEIIPSILIKAKPVVKANPVLNTQQVEEPKQAEET